MKNSLFFFLFAGAALASLRAEDPITSTIKFSQPDQPQIVRIYVSQGDLKVIATDSKDTVTVQTDAEPEKPSNPRPDGLRVIGSSSSFTLTENHNVVELNYGRDSITGAGADFTLHIPRNASIEVANGMGADINVDGVMGDIEIKNMNGEITLTNVGGGALVETMNGEIKATFASLPANKALSFTSMNGEIELHLPADAKANVRFRTQNGSILTDFPEETMKIKSTPAVTRDVTAKTARIAAETAREVSRVAKEVAQQVHEALEDAGAEVADGGTSRPPRPPRPLSIPSMVGGKVVSGQLNGGGIDLQIATMNGNIIVRKSVAKP